MKRFSVVFIQAVLLLVTCRVMAQTHQATTMSPLALPPNRNKALRQGIENDESSPSATEKAAPATPTPKRDCVCSKIYDPVCASNNESYFNLCYLECKVPKTDNVTVIHQGNCIPF